MFNSSKLTVIRKYSDHILLASLILIVSIVAYYRLLVQFDIGPFSDSCDFLCNAFVFAGNTGYFDPSRPPFFSFLIYLIFKAGFVSTEVIFILDCLMYILGVIGLFFLFKLFFNGIQSFIGSLLFATFPIIVVVMSAGFSDLPSVAITIWTFYFLILAVKKDSRFFYLVFPLAMLAFLTRYNNVLIIFPILLYILMNISKINEFKNIVLGMAASLLLLIPVFMFYAQKFGDMFYSFTLPFKMTSNVTILPESAAYDANLFFFIQKFPSFIGIEGIFVILIIIFCFFISILIKFNKEKRIQLNIQSIYKKFDKIKLFLFVALFLTFIFTFGNISYMFSEILFFILAYLFYDLTKNFNIKEMDTYLLFLAWFMAFFIFHSVFLVKDKRYFVVMAPAVAYFLILGLSEITGKLSFKIKNNNIVLPLISIALILIIIVSTASLIPGISQSNNKTMITNEIVYSADEWFVNYDPNYKNKVIYSDLWPFFCWDLKTDVNPMPVIQEGRRYYGGVKNFNITPQDCIEYNTELEKNNAYYYFCFREGVNLTSYRIIKQFGSLIIYERRS